MRGGEGAFQGAFHARLLCEAAEFSRHVNIFPAMSRFNKRRKARLIEQLGTIYISNISEGTAFLLQGVTKNDSKS